jgi:hypothetical protein
MKNFLSLPCFLVIFTDSKSENLIKEYRKEHLNRTEIIIKELKDTKMYEYMDYWEYCYSIDLEKYHSPDLYLIWAQKTFFVEEVIKKNPFSSLYFFWCDIGAFRNQTHLDKLKSFPNITKVSQLPKDKITLFSITPFNEFDKILNSDGIPQLYQNINGESCSKDICRIQGGFFGGTIDAWSNWVNLYLSTLDKFKKTKTFGGKDQAIMSTIALTNPDKVHIIQNNNFIDNLYIDIWFYFEYFLS